MLALVLASDDPVILPELPTYSFTPNWFGVLSLMLSVVLPVLAALLMRASWPSGVKGTVLLAISAATVIVEALLGDLTDGRLDQNVWELALTTGIRFGIAVLFYFGIWRGTGVQRRALAGGLIHDRPPSPR